jgi:hypothetical protein
MYKRGLLLCLFIVFFALAAYCAQEKQGNTINACVEAAANTESQRFYPVHLGNILYLKGYKKKEPAKELRVKAEVIRIEQKDNKDYYYFYAPLVGIRYLVREDSEGVYIRIMKYPFPLFGFPIEVDLKPEMKIMAHPLAEGLKWTYKGRAEAVILGIKLGRDVNTDFEVTKYEKLSTTAGEIDAYNITAMVDEGDGHGKHLEKYWYAKDIGYSQADTTGHFAQLVGYRIFNEKENKFDEKIPEGVEKYE